MLFDQEDKTDYLQELTKPGGKFDRSKYATEAEMWQAIAKGKVLGDRTIEMQNNRFDELRQDFILERDENTAKDSFEELRKTLLERKPEGTPITPVQPQSQATTPEDIAKSVQAEVLKLRQKEKEEANLLEVETRLRNRFGETAGTVFKDKMKTLELSDEDIRFLAKKSPNAVLNALGLNSEQDQYESPPRSSLRSDNFKPTVEIRDAVYYEKLRRDNKQEYFSEKTSIQRLKDMAHPDFMKRYQERQGQSL